MKYLAVLGRQPKISLAEIEAVFSDIERSTNKVCIFDVSDKIPDINRLGGVMKMAVELENKPLEYLKELPEGKITFGISDYSKNASKRSVISEALKIKKILVRHGRNVRVVENNDVVIPTATAIHNGISGRNIKKVEFIKFEDSWYKVIGVQDIDAYTKRDRMRPARDARVGMLPPKLAQILINLCGDLSEGATILDPFCGTGVVLQEALLMGYKAYGTDLSEKMVEYTEKNLNWLTNLREFSLDLDEFKVSQGDATSFKWQKPIDAVACEGYLGRPMSKVPSDIDFKKEKQECAAIVIGFLKNLLPQIEAETPVTIAVPAWLRESGEYSRLEILDEIETMGYNVNNKSREGLLYYREGQIVARDIIILRKK